MSTNRWGVPVVCQNTMNINGVDVTSPAVEDTRLHYESALDEMRSDCDRWSSIGRRLDREGARELAALMDELSYPAYAKAVRVGYERGRA